jgi:hypothetical protein
MFMLVHLETMMLPIAPNVMAITKIHRRPHRSLALAKIGLRTAVAVAKDCPNQIVLSAPPTMAAKNRPFYGAVVPEDTADEHAGRSEWLDQGRCALTAFNPRRLYDTCGKSTNRSLWQDCLCLCWPYAPEKLSKVEHDNGL